MAQALMVAGGVITAGGTLAQGSAAKRAAQFEATQLDRSATAARATASRAASEETRRSRLIQSRAQAVGAASGGGVPYDQIADIAGEGEYRALMTLFEGEEEAKGRETQADAARFSGKSAQRASRINAVGSLIQGGGSMFEKYGG